MNKCFALLSALLLGSGCAVGPNYKRPAVSAPDSYRGLTPEEAEKKQAASIGDQKWWDVFHDEQLRSLIRTALQQNYDARIAASRILAAQAQLGITRANQFPNLSAGAGISDNRSARSKLLSPFEGSTGNVNLSAAWELDFWGKYRRATEAARANLLASEWARQEVLATLVASVSSSYFQLRALDLQLEISKRTLGSRRESLRLTQVLADRGSTSLLDVRQAEQLVFTAAAEVPALEQQIEQEENFISTLLGKNPADVPRGQKLTEQAQPPEVPTGLTSSLLERRPDIREAEQQLVAANAEIGVARAAYFPQISLSGGGGFQSAALTNLFSGPAGTWNFGASLAQPIFTGGRLRSNVRLAEAQQQTAVLFYQQTIQGAFRGVSDALIAYRKSREFRAQEELLFQSAQDAAHLSHLRYNGGVTGYLEVLTNETNSFSAELALVQAQLNELLALVQLYEALGGGWQQ
ncbi:MAG TPA: efflux transporter outer membrane subunit [Candidatus Acidoferrum sp.]|nr:efflux transporter outer membrane subunit [Candidatus Acidoferrum sp.]